MPGHVDVRVYAELNDLMQREARGRIYWPWSPHAKLLRLVDRLRKQL